MASNDVRIELNHAAVAGLLKSSEAQAEVHARAERVAEAAGASGGEFGVDSKIGANRARATVWTADTEARIAEANDRVLTRSVDAGR